MIQNCTVTFVKTDHQMIHIEPSTSGPGKAPGLALRPSVQDEQWRVAAPNLWTWRPDRFVEVFHMRSLNGMFMNIHHIAEQISGDFYRNSQAWSKK